MARVLVTGGAGFMGSHVVDSLVAKGHDVLVADDLSTGTRSNIPPNVEFVDLDVADNAFVRRRLYADEELEGFEAHADETLGVAVDGV